MPVLPPSFGTSGGGGAIATPQPGASPQPAIQGTGLPPGDDMDEELQQRLFRLMAPSPEGVEAEIIPGMRSVPPQSPEEKEQRRQGFRALFDKLAQDPNAQQALLMAAAQIARPIDPTSGETVLNRLIQGAAQGTMTYDELQTRDTELEQQETENDLRARLLEERIESSKTDRLKTQYEIAESEEERQAQNALVQSIQEDTSLDVKTKERFTALAKSGNTKEALKLIAEKSGTGYMLSPDEIRELNPNIDPQTMIVTRRSNGDYMFTEIPGKDQPGDQRDRKIQDTTAALIDGGMEPEAAERNAQLVVDGILSIEVSEDGTQATLVNPVEALTGRGTGAQTVFRDPPPSGEQEESVVEVDELLFGDTAEKAVGLSSFYHNIVANVPSPLKGEATPEQREVVKARSRLNQFSRQVIQARILNPRYAIGEQEMIRKETKISPDLLTNPSALRDRMRALDKTLEIDIRQAKRDLNEGVFSGSERNKLRASIRGMENAREAMGVEKAQQLLESLDSPEKAMKLSKEEMDFLLTTIRDDELAELGDDVLAALLERKQQLMQEQ